MGAAVALTLAALYALLWMIDRRDAPNLALCLVAVAAAGSAYVELGMMHAQSAAEYGEWARWYHLPLFVGIIAQAFFIRYYLGTGRRWLLWTVTAASTVTLLTDFLSQPNFNWREVSGLGSVHFLGEHVSVVGDAVLRSWQWLPIATRLLLIVFVIDAIVQLWQKGGPEEKRKSLLAAAGIALPLSISTLLAQLVLLGLLQVPILNSPGFLLTLAVMTVQLTHGIAVNQRIQRELGELRREMARVSRITALGQLSSALAHELSQPLGAILRNAEAAELHLQCCSPNLEELRAIVCDIRKDDMRATEVIDRMRALIKHRSVEKQSVDLQELVTDVASLIHAEALARHVAVHCTVAPDLPRASCDRVHISQVLLNLIINAMDALDAGRASGRSIEIRARLRTDHTIEMAVADNGPGICPDAVDRIFDPFFTTKPGGMGIGLPVSRTIVEAHGGRLWAEPHASRSGATFRFTLPRA
jgi:signal transduction histidine kinase